MWYILVAWNLRRRYRGAWMLWGEVALILILILILIPSLYCDCDWSGGILNWVGEYMGWILGVIWDFGYPHLYTLYPFRIAVNTLYGAINGI